MQNIFISLEKCQVSFGGIVWLGGFSWWWWIWNSGVQGLNSGLAT
jgi:hypothetical protein